MKIPLMPNIMRQSLIHIMRYNPFFNLIRMSLQRSLLKFSQANFLILTLKWLRAMKLIKKMW